MRKSLSSLFILLLLLVTLWGACAWYFNNKSNDYLDKLFSDFTDHSSESSHTDVFKLQSIDTKRSFFYSKAKVKLQLNQEMEITQLLSILFSGSNSHLIEVSIKNGPLFIKKAGVKLAQSVWELSFIGINSQVSDIKLNKLTLSQNFDDSIHYKIDATIDRKSVKVTGLYFPKTQRIMGKIGLSYVSFVVLDQLLIAKDTLIDFDTKETTNRNGIHYQLSVPIVKINSLSSENSQSIKLTGEGQLQIKNSNVNNQTKIIFSNIEGSNKLFNQGEIRINLEGVALKYINEIFVKLNNIKSQREQIQWVLEEHAEVPEGQDQIWQHQDNISQLLKELPLSVEKLFVKNDSPLITFLVEGTHEKQKSKAIGSILPINAISVEPLTISSLIQAKAKVILGTTAFKQLRKQLPLKDQKFELIYKQNTLLMQ